MLEEKLKKIDGYFISLSKKGDYNGLEVSFPANWEIKEFEDLEGDKLIETHLQGDGSVIFIGNENVSLIELVEFVDLTAITNRENETKELLLDNKIKELREIFKTKRLSELENIKFIFATTDVDTSKSISTAVGNITDKTDVNDIKKMVKATSLKNVSKKNKGGKQ